MDPKLPASECNEHLFRKLLELLKKKHNFRDPQNGSTFVVYAHDSPNGATPAYAKIVIEIIRWLEDLDTFTVTDRNPLPGSRVEGQNAATNVFMNQMCVAPPSTQKKTSAEIEAADKIILCGSPLLEQYCKDPWALGYMEQVQRCYQNNRQQLRPQLRLTLRDFVDENGRGGSFHHVLTEVALLRMRFQQMGEDHGVIPLALGVQAFPYVPEFTNTDLRVHFSPGEGQDIHALFFKLLKRIYHDHDRLIKIFADIYKEKSVSQPLTSSDLEGMLDQAKDAVSIAFDNMADTLRKEHANRAIRLRHESQLQDRRVKFLSRLEVLDRKNQNETPVDTTCDWFVTHNCFKQWRSSKNQRLLLVTADPGAGKSVLSRYLVDSRQCVRGVDAIVPYFFFKDDSDDQKSVVKALQSILHQLFTYRKSLLTTEIIQHFEITPAMFHNVHDLWQTLLSISKIPQAPRMMCIVDGLDESDDEGKSIFQAIGELYNEENAQSRLQFLVTCRPYHKPMIQLRTLQARTTSVIHIDCDGPYEKECLYKSIAITIIAKVRALTRYSIEDKRRVLVEVEKTFNVTHLWVNLMLKNLNSSKAIPPNRLIEEIRKGPQTLDEDYERLLERIEPGDQQRARQILSIVLCATTPLTVEDLALAIELKAAHLGAKERPDVVRADLFRQDLRPLTGLILTVVENKVYFMHSTARTFLVAKRDSEAPTGSTDRNWKWKSSFDLAQAHRDLAEVCMVRLSLGDFDLPDRKAILRPERPAREALPTGESSIKDRYDNDIKLPLLRYSIHSWILHSRRAGALLRDIMYMALNCCETPSRYNPTWRSHVPLPFERKTNRLEWRDLNEVDAEGIPGSRLAIACWWNLKPVVDHFIRNQGSWRDQDYINRRDERFGYTALHCATIARNHSILRALTELMGEPLDLNARDYESYTALHHAAMVGDQIAMTLLLDAGAEIDPDCFFSTSPLWLVISRVGNEELVRFLLQRGASPLCENSVVSNTAEHWKNTSSDPLFLAAELGHSHLMKLFIEPLRSLGHDINTKNNQGETVLHRAIRYGCSLEFVETVIRLGVNKDMQDSQKRTPMHLAVLEDRADLVRTLRQHGASLDCFHHWPTTAVHLAVQQRKMSVIKQLLKSGINWTTLVDGRGATLMHSAVEGADKVAIQSLASIHPSMLKARDKQGRTPLHYASKVGSVDILSLFIRSGSPLEARDGLGWTPLHHAADRGSLNVITELLDSGANKKSKTNKGSPPIEKLAESDTIFQHAKDKPLPARWFYDEFMPVATRLCADESKDYLTHLEFRFAEMQHPIFSAQDDQFR